MLLKPGLLPPEAAMDRLAYIAANPWPWKLVWGSWIAAALCLIFLFAQWGALLDRWSAGDCRGPIVFGVLAGALGMIPDTLAEVLYLHHIPLLAREAVETSDPARQQQLLTSFQTLEPLLAMLTGFLGNGFYTIGGWTLNLVSLRVGRFPRGLAVAGLPIWCSSTALSASTVAGWTAGVTLFTALTMATFVLWAAAVGLFFRPRRRP